MANEEQDKKERVTLDDVVEVLAKHSASPNDPDDADTLSRFNQQVADDRAGKQEQEDTAQRKETPTSPPTQTTRKGRE